jgi:uncharacterized tellurite resistance protein B-like protein
MELRDMTADQARLGLGAMKAVAMANGAFEEAERELLQAAAKALSLALDPDALAPAAPEEVARGLADPAWRLRLVQALIVMALIDGEASPAEAELIDRFAEALEVRDSRARVSLLHHLIEGRLSMIRLDMARRQPVLRQALGQVWQEQGLRGLFKFVRTMSSVAAGNLPGGAFEPEIAWRYRQLGLLPEGTFGREFWKHMTERRFAFPGEPGGIPEVMIHHDLTHVLTGYDTTPEGETQIASFYAGYQKEDPFAFIFMVLVMFHLGIKLAAPEPGKGFFDPKKVLRAMERGAAMNVDLTDHWDHWAVVELPIEEVRRRYNIL